MAGRALVVPKKEQTETLPLEEQIRQRAHAIYLERDGQDGAEMDDWLQAEQEILSQQAPETSGN
jgi:hypothetical protein